MPEPTLDLHSWNEYGEPIPSPYSLSQPHGSDHIPFCKYLLTTFAVPSPRVTNEQDIVPDLKELRVQWEKCVNK